MSVIIRLVTAPADVQIRRLYYAADNVVSGCSVYFMAVSV